MKNNKENTCQTCEHFIQHYICSNHRYTPINAGHCIRTRRTKNCQGLDPGCEHWLEQSEAYQAEHEPPKERFVRFLLLEEK